MPKLIKPPKAKAMQEFTIKYSFDGYGTCTVFAKNENQAENKFYEGFIIDDEEKSQNYTIDKILKNKGRTKGKI
jgi:hypothetical protein